MRIRDAKIKVGRGERHFLYIKKNYTEFFLFFYFSLKYINSSEKNNTQTSKKQCRIGIEISVTAKEVATITKEKSQKCFKQTGLKENK